MNKFLMPSLGADMKSGVLIEWMVKEGDTVKKGQSVALIETSKAVVEIEVFVDGIVDKILVEEGTECSVGTVLALIRSKDEETKERKNKIVESENTQKEERIKVSPLARKKAQKLGVDIKELASKTKETIRLSHVEDANKKDKKVSKKDTIRQAIAEAMSRSNAQIPHYYLSTSINMTPALDFLEEINVKRNIKDRILPIALLIRAIVLALEEVPELNGFWIDDSLKVSKEINPGIAIAIRGGGVMTPALINAKDMKLEMTMKSLDELINRTRGGQLRSQEMSTQTITITNLGDLGVESVYGVIFPPQVAIVGLGQIKYTPWVDGDKLSVQKVVQVSLAGDHRATDGRAGALFLDKLNNFLQKPKDLL